jgi:hypothetical protein
VDASPKGLGPEKDCAGKDQQHIENRGPSSRQRGRPHKNRTVNVKQPQSVAMWLCKGCLAVGYAVRSGRFQTKSVEFYRIGGLACLLMLFKTVTYRPFESVAEFKYLGRTLANRSCCIHDGVTCRSVSGNAWCPAAVCRLRTQKYALTSYFV